METENYNLKAVNPLAEAETDARTPDELLELIEAKGLEVAEAPSALRALGLKNEVYCIRTRLMNEGRCRHKPSELNLWKSFSITH